MARGDKRVAHPCIKPFLFMDMDNQNKMVFVRVCVCDVILSVLPSIQMLLVVYNCQSHYEIYAVHFSVLEEHRYSSLIPPNLTSSMIFYIKGGLGMTF